MTTETATSTPGTDREERRITYLSIWLNIGLTALKLAAGLWGRSQALLADAIHSGSDFVTDFAVLVGLKMAARPWDADHAYGHGKYETVVAALIGLALAGAAVRIGWDAVQRIFAALHGSPPVAPEPFAFWVAAASIGIKEGLYRTTMRVARTTGSGALLANAWHHRSDAFSSVATAAGVGAATFLGKDWTILDPIAALFVSVILLRVGARLIRDQLGELTDQSLPPAVCEEIMAMARAMPGIEEPHHLRTRRVGRETVVDLHIRLHGDLPLREAHARATMLEQKLKQRFGTESIITLHLEPYVPVATADPLLN